MKIAERLMKQIEIDKKMKKARESFDKTEGEAKWNQL
jgi:hypothetical protein